MHWAIRNKWHAGRPTTRSVWYIRGTAVAYRYFRIFRDEKKDFESAGLCITKEYSVVEFLPVVDLVGTVVFEMTGGSMDASPPQFFEMTK